MCVRERDERGSERVRLAVMWREGGREGGWVGGREGRREGGREGGRGGREGGRERGREGGREGGFSCYVWEKGSVFQRFTGSLS